jgi:hypothetical protein
MNNNYDHFQKIIELWGSDKAGNKEIAKTMVGLLSKEQRPLFWNYVSEGQAYHAEQVIKHATLINFMATNKLH